ncbi:MAG TPA: trypsin-like peptidase domain-containing protein [Leptolyngbyaceae cyanobacterium]
MFKIFSYGLSAALMGAAIVVVQPQITVPQTLDEQAIASLAREATVFINGQNPGSGVIISRKGNTYYVLTAQHVVNSPDEYEIVTSDGTKHSLDYSTVKKLPGVDLALVQFTSDKHRRIAPLGDSDVANEGKTVYISGWPHPGRAIAQRIFQLTSGKISGRPLEPLDKGYGLVYTNTTRVGMSGGPVWDAQGRVIGIHGQAEGEQIVNQDGNTISVKDGFNLGVPINSFLKLASQNGINLLYLRDNFSLANTLSTDKRCSEKVAGNVTFSPDNQVMAIPLQSGEISLCARTTGKELRTIKAHSLVRGIRSLLFSPDGKSLVSIGEEEGNRSIANIKIWNVNTGELLHTFTINNQVSTYLPTFSPDGKTLATGHDKIIRIWNLNTAKLLHELDNDEGVWGMTISPDSQILASGNLGGTIKIWNLGTGKLLRTIKGHSTPVIELNFSPFGQILASGSASSKQIYNLQNSPRGNVDDASIKIWNWQTGELLHTLKENSASIGSLAIEPNGQILASSSNNEIEIWSLDTGQLLRTLDAGKPVEVAFSADGQMLFSHNFVVDETQIWQLSKP